MLQYSSQHYHCNRRKFTTTLQGLLKSWGPSDFVCLALCPVERSSSSSYVQRFRVLGLSVGPGAYLFSGVKYKCPFSQRVSATEFMPFGTGANCP
eukprot:3804222-Amphidinium_carterae.1